MLDFYKFIISLAVAGKHGKRDAMRARLSHMHCLVQAVSNWLNPRSLVTISVSGFIENLT